MDSCLYGSLFVYLGMKVKDLILELQNLNPESEITFGCHIDTGRDTTVCDEGEIEIIEDEDDSTVEILINGEETDYQKKLGEGWFPPFQFVSLGMNMKENHLRIAKELLETRFNVKITSIEFEDGSGDKFIVTTANNPTKRQFVKL